MGMKKSLWNFFAKKNPFALQKNTKISQSFDEEQDHTRTINSIAYA